MDFTTPTQTCFIRGLGHPDAIVRNECLSYLRHCRDLSIDVTREFFSNVCIHGPDFYEYPHMAEGFPFDKEALETILMISRRWHDEGYEVELGQRYVRLFGRAPAELYSWAIQRLEKEAWLSDNPWYLGALSGLKELQSIEVLSSESALTELRELLKSIADCERFPHYEVEKALALSDLLVRKGEVLEMETLAREWVNLEANLEEGNPDDWFVLIGVHLCGKLKLDDQTDRLLDLFAIDWDVLNERISHALVEMQSGKALRRIAERWDALPGYGRLFTSSVFEHMCPEGFEDFYARAIDIEDDSADFENNSLAIAWAHSGTQEALDNVQALADECDWLDPELESVLQALYAQYVLRDYNPDQAATLKHYFLDLESGRIIRKSPFARYLDSKFGDDFLTDESLPPYVRDAPKVGRNDPCPCGSGKKYKKCCLK